jgi:hypothetical protein
METPRRSGSGCALPPIHCFVFPRPPLQLLDSRRDPASHQRAVNVAILEKLVSATGGKGGRFLAMLVHHQLACAVDVGVEDLFPWPRLIFPTKTAIALCQRQGLPTPGRGG